MNGSEIISKLIEYQLKLLNVLNLNESRELTIDLTSEYSYITIDIMKSAEQFARIQFTLDDEAGEPSNIYCQENTNAEWILKKIKPESWPGWNSPSIDNLHYSNEVMQSLQTADSIAALATNCASGDNYRPGNFSKISFNSQRIELRQINHMNAKSLAHKQNYSLRNLVFTIPFEEDKVKKKRFETYQVGNMIIEFSDNSSQNNKPCGQRIIEALNRLQ